jgi:predicted RNase H-like HicB family nuclease
MTDHLVVYESNPDGCSTYVPDVPGCVAAAATRQEAEVLIREALEIHIAGLQEAGMPVPAATTVAGTVPA